jgi:hypothetical protein
MTMTIQAQPAFPFHLHWTPGQLADSVPLRLFELPLFDAREDGAPASANQTRRRSFAVGYAPRTMLASCFRIH